MTRPILHEPHAKHINLLHAHPRNRHMRPDRHEQRRNRMEAVVALIGALAFCWWLGGRIHAAVVAKSQPFVHVVQAVDAAVRGE